MTEQEEKEIGKLNAGRILREASRELLPFLDQMREDAIANIVNSHRSSEQGKLPTYAAELSVIDALRGKLTRSNRETERREEKLYGSERQSAES